MFEISKYKKITAIKIPSTVFQKKNPTRFHAPLEILCYVLFEYDTVQVTMINLGHWICICCFQKKILLFWFPKFKKDVQIYILDVTFLKQHDLFAADVLITRCLDSASKFCWFSCKLRNISCPN